MQSLNATRQPTSTRYLVESIPIWIGQPIQQAGDMCVCYEYIESEARGHAQWRWRWRWLLPSCGYGGLSCLAMRNNNYKWSDVNFSWQYLLFTLAQLYFRYHPRPTPLFPLPLYSCPIQLYRAVLSLNKWNLLLTVSDPNYTYRLFISIYTHTHAHMQSSIKSIATWQSDAV